MLAVANDVNRAVHEHEELPTGGTLTGQHLSAAEVDLVREARDPAQLLLRATGEQRNSRQQIDLPVLVQPHARSLFRNRTEFYSSGGALAARVSCTLPEMRPSASSSSLKFASVMTRARSGDVAVIVALRGFRSTSAPSPRKSPGPSWLIFTPFRSTLTVPSRRMNISRPGPPCFVRIFPSRNASSSAMSAIRRSSFVEHAANRGTCRSSSTFSSRERISA